MSGIKYKLFMNVEIIDGCDLFFTCINNFVYNSLNIIKYSYYIKSISFFPFSFLTFSIICTITFNIINK